MAIVPKYETSGASGLDLSAVTVEKIFINPGEKKIISTGISVSIPKNFELQIRPRSGLAAKNSISILNTPGTIDSDYRGEIKVILINHGEKIFEINNGSRIAQMVLCPIVRAELKEVDNLDATARGKGGFGSTGS